MNRTWITWEAHRRSRGLSSAFGASLHELDERGGRLRRYASCTWRTLSILWRARGSIVFVQSPSVALALLTTTVGRLMARIVVVDAHNGGIDPFEGRNRLFTWAAHCALRMSDLVIVTNSGLARRVERLGARAAVLTDPMPDLPQATPEADLAVTRILAICTWASDEPFRELIAAAALLPAGYELAITGRDRLTDTERAALPPNVRLTGFVSESEYVRLLRGARAIVDLTTREDCLLCGAYEAISAHKALVVSDTQALRALLADAAVYCANDARSVAAGIVTAVRRADELQDLARTRDRTLRVQWLKDHEDLERRIGELTGR